MSGVAKAAAPAVFTKSRRDVVSNGGMISIWGGEAVAVRHDGRANPQQLLLSAATERTIASLRDDTIAAHRDRFGSNADTDLWIGLQLTHSGRYARPDVYDQPAPLAAAHHP